MGSERVNLPSMKLLFCLFVCLLASADVAVEEDVPEWEKELQQELQVQRYVCYDPPPNTHTGADPGIFERGGPEAIIFIYKILERGGPKPLKMSFECSFQSFSYKYFANISQKGGAQAPWAPPLNPPLPYMYLSHKGFSFGDSHLHGPHLCQFFCRDNPKDFFS